MDNLSDILSIFCGAQVASRWHLFQFGSNDSGPEYLKNAPAVHVEVSSLRLTQFRMKINEIYSIQRNSIQLGLKLFFDEGSSPGADYKLSTNFIYDLLYRVASSIISIIIRKSKLQKWEVQG